MRGTNAPQSSWAFTASCRCPRAPRAAAFRARSLRADQGLAGWVASHGRPLAVPNVRSDPRTVALEWFEAHGLTSVHATPIVVHSSLLGVLVLFGTVPFRLQE